MLAVLKRELKSYYQSLFAYIYYALFFVVLGIFLSSFCLDNYSTQFGYYVMQYAFYVVLLFIPFCTMRVFAKERKDKTDQLIFTAPVSNIEILLGKYLATTIFVLSPVLISLIFPLMINSLGDMSIDFVFSAYLGGVLLCTLMVSVGLFVSSCTNNAILAAVITIGVYILAVLGRFFESMFVDYDVIYNNLCRISFYNKYIDMMSGIVRSGDVIYLVVLIILFFVLTWISLWGRRKKRSISLGVTAVVVIASFMICIIGFATNNVYDFTGKQLLTLSDTTVDALKEIKQPTYICYMGAKNQANATYVELLNRYKKYNAYIDIQYVDMQDEEFISAYLGDLPKVNESSLVVISGERSIYLDSDDYISVMNITNYEQKEYLELEDQITSAILYTNSMNDRYITKTIGHGESVLTTKFESLLNLSNFNINNMDSLTETTTIDSVIEDTTKAIFIQTPSEDFEENELEMFDRYVKEGGNLIVALDPLNENLTNLYDFLKKYGLNVQQGVIIEPQEGYYAYDTHYYLVPKLNDVDMTADLSKRGLSVASYTSKGIATYGSATDCKVTDLLLTSSESFSKVDDFDNINTKGQSDKSGPFSVASISKHKNGGSVFLITSEVFFNEDADEESGGSNSRFFVEMIKSIVSGDNNQWIQGRDIGDHSANYSYAMKKRTKIITVGVIPALCIILGILCLIVRDKNIIYDYLEKKAVKAPVDDHDEQEGEDENEE